MRLPFFYSVTRIDKCGEFLNALTSDTKNQLKEKGYCCMEILMSVNISSISRIARIVLWRVSALINWKVRFSWSIEIKYFVPVFVPSISSTHRVNNSLHSIFTVHTQLASMNLRISLL